MDIGEGEDPGPAFQATTESKDKTVSQILGII